MNEIRTFHFEDGREETYELVAQPYPPPFDFERLPPIWRVEKCAVCGRGFTETSWNARHTARDGLHDVHENCCRAPDCRAAQLERKQAAAPSVTRR